MIRAGIPFSIPFGAWGEGCSNFLECYAELRTIWLPCLAAEDPLRQDLHLGLCQRWTALVRV